MRTKSHWSQLRGPPSLAGTLLGSPTAQPSAWLHPCAIRSCCGCSNDTHGSKAMGEQEANNAAGMPCNKEASEGSGVVSPLAAFLARQTRNTYLLP